ncbi:MAG: 3-hydroxyacyl-ACP dehydratase FabZ [Alphaproteobacteria bacterium]|jgi:3-hydroxyacyl-[acyl-carrier-protein] dehydratase|nr:3-hydroxyacyl-ACP dehydratase FabZ [Alphaproteobacteria bacterium]
MNAPADIMEYEDIEKAIPHRPPFLLIDRVINIQPGESATGIKAVSGGEPYFVGHFPGKPVLPGVLITEALAQTASCLVACSIPNALDGNLVFLTNVDSAKFRKPVTPGHILELHVKKTAGRSKIWKFEGQAMIGDQLMAEAQFAAMIVPRPV